MEGNNISAYITTKVSDHQYDHCYDPGVKGQGKIYLIICLIGDNRNYSFIFDGGCSCLAHRMPIVCRLQQKF